MCAVLDVTGRFKLNLIAVPYLFIFIMYSKGIFNNCMLIQSVYKLCGNILTAFLYQNAQKYINLLISSKARFDSYIFVS